MNTAKRKRCFCKACTRSGSSRATSCGGEAAETGLRWWAGCNHFLGEEALLLVLIVNFKLRAV